MKKIITAIGNEILNKKLKKEKGPTAPALNRASTMRGSEMR